MKKCWEEMSEKRPTFSTLKTVFAEMLQENNSYFQLDNVTPYYPNSLVLEEMTRHQDKQIALLEERVDEEKPLQSLSSSSSSSLSESSSSVYTPVDCNNYELLKDNAGIYV